MKFIDDFVMDNLIGIPKNETQSNVSDALARYFTISTLQRVVQGASPESLLRMKQIQLDIEMKKRAMGIPQDTESFNQQLNSPANHLIAALGIKFEDALDSPSLIQKTIRAANPLRDLFNVNRPISSGLPELGGGLRRLLKLR